MNRLHNRRHDHICQTTRTINRYQCHRGQLMN